MSALIRRAKVEDAAHIIIAHVTSIRELCSKDYSPAQIKAWAGRAFSTENWIKRIQNTWVWVVELDGFVEGVGFMRSLSPDIGFIDAFYFTSKITGKKLGARLMAEMAQEARDNNFKTIDLESTRTSLEFYKKQGFVQTGPALEVDFGGVFIEAFPMSLTLK